MLLDERPVGVTGLGQGNDTVQDGSQPAVLDEPGDALGSGAVGFDDDEGGACPMAGGLLRIRRCSDADQDSTGAQHAPGAGLGDAAHRVDDHVDVGDVVLEAVVGVVDGLAGAQPPDQ